MAKITGYMVAQKAPSLRGNVYVSTWRGIAILKKWPKKRKNIRPLVNQEQEDWFRQANILTKYIDPEMQITARNAVKGTPLYPRDVQVALMAGRLLGLNLGAEGKLYSMAVKNQVSESLDVITQTVGGLLVRKSDGWDILPQGTTGQVLTSKGPGQLPVYEAGGGGGSGIWEDIAYQSAPVSNQFDFTGLDFSTYQAIRIIGTNIEAQTAEGFFQMEVYDNGTKVTAGYRWAFEGYSTSNFTRTVRSASDSKAAISMTGTNWGVRPLTGQGSNFDVMIGGPSDASNRLLVGNEVHEQTTGESVSSRFHAKLPIATELDGFLITEPTNGIAAGQVKIIGLLK
jgi:hypothetical protein